jgi:hypothetical protein
MSAIRAEVTELLRRPVSGSKPAKYGPTPSAVEQMLLHSLCLARREFTLKIRHELLSQAKTQATHRRYSLLSDFFTRIA